MIPLGGPKPSPFGTADLTFVVDRSHRPPVSERIEGTAIGIYLMNVAQVFFIINSSISINVLDSIAGTAGGYHADRGLGPVPGTLPVEDNTSWCSGPLWFSTTNT